jgi:hypothetical protein
LIQVLLTEEEQQDVSSALEQIADIYELKASELEKNIKVAQGKIVDLRESRHTVLELMTKVTLAKEEPEELEAIVTDEPIPPKEEDFTPTHTICMCDYCQHIRQSIITDDSIEQME